MPSKVFLTKFCMTSVRSSYYFMNHAKNNNTNYKRHIGDKDTQVRTTSKDFESSGFIRYLKVCSDLTLYDYVVRSCIAYLGSKSGFISCFNYTVDMKNSYFT